MSPPSSDKMLTSGSCSIPRPYIKMRWQYWRNLSTLLTNGDFHDSLYKQNFPHHQFYGLEHWSDLISYIVSRLNDVYFTRWFWFRTTTKATMATAVLFLWLILVRHPGQALLPSVCYAVLDSNLWAVMSATGFICMRKLSWAFVTKLVRSNRNTSPSFCWMMLNTAALRTSTGLIWPAYSASVTGDFSVFSTCEFNLLVTFVRHVSSIALDLVSIKTTVPPNTSLVSLFVSNNSSTTESDCRCGLCLIVSEPN